MRTPESGTQYKNIARDHTVRHWKKLLGNSNNNNGLVTFQVTEWKQEWYRRLLEKKPLMVISQDICFCFKITMEGSEEVQALKSTQEEADACLLFHAADIASSGFKAIIMVSDDTRLHHLPCIQW